VTSETSNKCANVSVPKNSSLLDPKGAQQKGQYYLLFESNVPWTSASASCESASSELVSVININVALADLVDALNKIQRLKF
jgi:hypothetical protein